MIALVGLPGCQNYSTFRITSPHANIYIQSISLPVARIAQNTKSIYKDPNKTGIALYDTQDKKGTKLSQYFTVHEFSHSGDTSFRFARIDPQLVNCLANLRAYFNAPVRINSSYRSWAYNKKLISNGEKASKKSFHMSGKAADFFIHGIASTAIAEMAYRLCGCGIGVGIAKKWLHIDVRGYSTRPWGYSVKNKRILKTARAIHRKQCGKGRKSDEESVFENAIKDGIKQIKAAIDQLLKQ